MRFNVSQMVIGLTIVAVGTSLPELSVTVTAVLRGHAGMAIGNVVGSNILNILAVLAIPALLDPRDLPVVVLWRDYGMMVALTALLILFAYGIGLAPSDHALRGFCAVGGVGGLHRLVYRQEALSASPWEARRTAGRKARPERARTCSPRRAACGC